MKRIVLILLTLLMLSACAEIKYDSVYIASPAIKLSEKDAADVYAFLQKTVKEGTSSLNPEDKYIGGQTISICTEKGEKTTQYMFLLDTLFVKTPNGETKEYKIKQDYYEREFYPFVSRIFDQYFPVYYQVTNSSQQLSIIMRKDGETKDLEREEVLDIAFLIAYNYLASEIISEPIEGELCQIIIDDGFVNEVIHFFRNYVVLNDRKIMLPEGYNITWQN